MSHVNTTPHYGLPIYGENDIINPLTDFNDANSAIDTALYEIADAQGTEAGAISDINTFLGDKELETVAQNVTDAINEVNTAVGNADTAIGNVAGDVVTLQTAVGNSSTGLIHDVSELQTTVGSQGNSITALQGVVGDADSGLVKNVTDLATDVGGLETTVGDADSGLVKDVDNIKTQNGSETLNTTAQTLSGAINELNAKETFVSLGSDVNLTQYTTSQPYVTPSDGYVLAFVFEGTSNIALAYIANTNFGAYVKSIANGSAETVMFVKKGTPIYGSVTGNGSSVFKPINHA